VYRSGASTASTGPSSGANGDLRRTRSTRVKNYGPKNSLDRGAQLEVVWLGDA
jgi:hypothetical protein